MIDHASLFPFQLQFNYKCVLYYKCLEMAKKFQNIVEMHIPQKQSTRSA